MDPNIWRLCCPNPGCKIRLVIHGKPMLLEGPQWPSSKPKAGFLMSPFSPPTTKRNSTSSGSLQDRKTERSHGFLFPLSHFLLFNAVQKLRLGDVLRSEALQTCDLPIQTTPENLFPRLHGQFRWAPFWAVRSMTATRSLPSSTGLSNEHSEPRVCLEGTHKDGSVRDQSLVP